MIFDLFHSLSDPLIAHKAMGPKRVFQQFLEQVQLAESMGMDTVWLAESHFSSETQKRGSAATIPHFFGEVGLNADTFQLFSLIVSRTKKISLGSAIHNIVGGSGGPIASADRVNTLNFINQNFWGRTLRLGVSSGRFPYQNLPFGILPRNETEVEFWPLIRRFVFLEALEIFLRLINGETLNSDQVSRYTINERDLEPLPQGPTRLKLRYKFPLPVHCRWKFEALTLVPAAEVDESLKIVLGSSDPWALDVASRYFDVDLFNLSFTHPDEIEKLHHKMFDLCGGRGRIWRRGRLPRTVLVFIDPVRKRAHELANHVIDGYIEAMRGTVHVPDKRVLLERALVGDAPEIIGQLNAGGTRGFDPDDRLMLWFEFFQQDGETIAQRMRYFFDKVVPRVG